MAQSRSTASKAFEIQDLLYFLRQDELDYPAGASKFGKAAIPILSDLVEGSDENLAIKAAYLLGYIDDKAADPILEKAASEGIAPVRIAAAFGAQKKSAAVAEKILQRSLEDSDASVVKFALRSATAMKLGKNLQPKIDKISKTFFDEEVKSAAMDVMKKLK